MSRAGRVERNWVDSFNTVTVPKEDYVVTFDNDPKA